MTNLTKIIIPVFIFAALVIGVMSLKSGEVQKPVETFAAQIPSETIVAVKDQDILSPDGKMTLRVNQKKAEEGNTWVFSVGDDQILKATYPTEVSIIVPFNTFSPDNKYIFLKKLSPGSTHYIVLATDGKSFSSESQGLEVTSLFYEKYTDYKITDVTGWASPTLCVINTDKISGGEGPSFWFDVSSKSFIQLSTRFN